MLELLMELASTIALTLLLCHFIIKLVSSPPASFASKLSDGETVGDYAVKSDSVGSEIKNRVAIIEEEEEDHALREDENHSTDEKFAEHVKVVEEAIEIVLNRYAEEFLLQESSGESGGRREEDQAPASEEALREEEIVERAEFVERVREIVDESLDAVERMGRYAEKLMEQEISGEDGGCIKCGEEDQAPESEALREDENHCTDEKFVERLEKVQEIVDESLEAVEQEISGKYGDCFSTGEIEECLGEEDDDWVGIERTELEKLFGSAMAFTGSTDNEARISGLDSDVKAKLYGLRKIAIQGPCLEPQPMALKLLARAKWNAWQQLGKMTPEIAMEQYVSLLSKSVPDWMHDEHKKA